MENLVHYHHNVREGLTKHMEYLWILQLVVECEAAFEQSGKARAQDCVLAKVGIQDLRGALRHGDGVIRRKTLQLLSVLEPKEALKDVSDVLVADPCPVVRHEAAFFLGALKSEDAVAPLCQALLRDKEDLVRHEAAEALGDLGYKSALPALSEATKDGSSVVRDTARLAILQLKKE